MINPNRPEKDSEIKVEPIRDLNDIKTIKKLLADNPRNHTLFEVGINTNLKPSELLSIKAGIVKNLKPMDTITLKDEKTGKNKEVALNRACTGAIATLLSSQDFEDSDYLFLSQRKGVLTVSSLSRLVKKWCDVLNLKGNYASHTLRKTWGYHQIVSFNVGISELMVYFNHSSQRQTREYLCISDEDQKSIYENEM